MQSPKEITRDGRIVLGSRCNRIKYTTFIPFGCVEVSGEASDISIKENDYI